MTEQFQKTASLHEKTVQGIAEGSVAAMSQQSKGRRKHTQPVQSIKVNPLVWAQVQSLLKQGHYTQFEILSETEVRVK